MLQKKTQENAYLFSVENGLWDGRNAHEPFKRLHASVSDAMEYLAKGMYQGNPSLSRSLAEVVIFSMAISERYGIEMAEEIKAVQGVL